MKTVVYTIFATTLLALSAPAQAAHHEFTIDDVAFMTGHWKGSEEMGGPEEGWFAPKAGVMTAVFRWPNVSGRYIVELLTIAEEEDQVVFRFKHFDPDVIAWEKEQANTYILSDVSDNCATFDGIDTPKHVPATIQYCRPDEDTLIFRGGSEGEAIEDSDFVIEFKKF